MGTWGVGNFDSDGALDYVGDLIDAFVATIEDAFEDTRQDLHEGEARLMPTVEISATLCEHCGSAPPDPPTVAGWKRRYLEIFDEQIGGFLIEGKEAYADQRRARSSPRSSCSNASPPRSGAADPVVHRPR